jgi:hypothetical protein
MRNLGIAATALVSLFAVSCADENVTDELAGAEEAEPADGKGDTSEAGVHTYYELAGDMRKCAFPLCGGFHLDRLNASSTKCHDGSSSESCYTPELDFSESGLNQDAIDKLRAAAFQGTFEGVHAIVRGRFAKKNFTTPSPTLGRFIVTEAWLSQSGTVSSGVFAKIKDNGLRCFAAPCPSLSEKALNTSRSANISEVDFAPSEITDDQIGEAINDTFEPHGLIVAGDRFNFKIDGRKGKGRTATAVYRRLKNAATGACFVGGCSGQICSDQEGVISTCEFRPEYACYDTATCERQSDGNCGWTQTTELQACLGAANCCDPALEPGGIEGAHCCADGSWRGDIGNGGSDECIPFGGDGHVCQS